MQDLVSIGMPVFNDKQFLTQALEALAAQSYSNCELIISDDCSTDGSEAICLEFAARDSRIRYIRQPTNLGISRNMMFLLAEARGEYFMWAGDDDLWHPEFITTLHAALQRDTESVSAFTPFYFVDEKTEPRADLPVYSSDYSGPTAYQRLMKLITVFDDCFGYGLFRREAIAKVRFPVWWGVNRNWAGNNIYPTLCFYLAKGNFVLAGDTPMLYKRLKEGANSPHTIPYPNSFVRGVFAYVLWKFNMVVASLNQITVARQGWTAARVAPEMFYRWMIVPAWEQLLSRGARLWRKKISFF